MATDTRIPSSVDRLTDLEAKSNHLVNPDLGLHTIPGGIFGCNSDAVTLASGTVIFARLPSPPVPKLITHMEAHVGQTESATETDQRLGLYKTTAAGTGVERLAVTGASTTLFEVDDDPVNAALSSEVWVNPADTLWAAVLSVASTAGTLVGFALTGIGAATTKPATTSHPVRAYTLAGQTALDASELFSGMTAVGYVPWLFARYDV